MLLYRVIPWSPDARPGEPGHALFVPPSRSGSRIDNPAHYKVLYASDRPEGAVAEAFGRRQVWSDSMLASSRFPGARRALVEYVANTKVVDLDDGEALARRKIKPSSVASPDRKETRAWALRVFQEGNSDGIRWWSARDSRWGVFGLWRLDSVAAGEADVLDRNHPAMQAAARYMRRFWVD